jgi:hypothetical protein
MDSMTQPLVGRADFGELSRAASLPFKKDDFHGQASSSPHEERATRRVPPIAWIALVVLPNVSLFFAASCPPWLFMWALALSIYAGAKWLTFADAVSPRAAFTGRGAGYLCWWPGMDAATFLKSRRPGPLPRTTEWLFALTKFLYGLVLYLAAATYVDSEPHLAAWTALVGIVFTLHFGLFHLLALAWQAVGVRAVPIMDAPVRATSLAEFWGRRWNRAFRDLAHAYVFRPLVRRYGPTPATWATFLVSGLVHDLVISVPAGGGFGLPTAYFLVQGLGHALERSPLGRRLGLGTGVRGWLFCLAVTAGPVGLLLHRPFLEHVVVPMLWVTRTHLIGG